MSIIKISQFTKKVIQQTKLIPSGKVATYKQIATLAGKPQGSRGVGWILNSCSTVYKLPWQRVINSKGAISFEKGTYNFKKQKRLLEKEGVFVTSDGKTDLSIYQWKKKPRITESKSGQPKMFRG